MRRNDRDQQDAVRGPKARANGDVLGKWCRCNLSANFLRFRALAFLGRLPSERVDGSAIQASEKPAQ